MFPLNLFCSNPYQSLTTLRGQRDAITSLTFSVFGQFVAAAGLSGVVIWDIETLQVVPLTLTPDNIRDPLKNTFPAACWIYFAQQNRHVLLLGSFAGTIQLWDYIDVKLRFECKRKPVPHLTAAAEAAPQVLAVDCFPREVPVGKKAQIVVSFGDSSLGVWTLEADGKLKQNFVVALEAELFPKVVTLLHGGSGNTLWRKTTALNLMGAVAVNKTYEHFVACTSDGFELFNLEQMNLVRKLEHQPALLALPKQVSFVGQHILGGTDCRCAEVYALKSGKVVQSLKYPQGGLVQSVAASDTYWQSQALMATSLAM
ncbi:hypothetical protein GYMLUDRAFT_250939 [Collybiopsis luxurians FD-317 M1]|uniref:Uncharacterized protein n=1 Tax=Collybiopsis luxurians FD-317 M1 TaxID=944289 RepID=A0A0D0C4Q7_9AGAR|nr:hypothetical protein GYMLUDRAFT_250939 [Collybiopsis luxurians FD-317 M1]